MKSIIFRQTHPWCCLCRVAYEKISKVIDGFATLKKTAQRVSHDRRWWSCKETLEQQAHDLNLDEQVIFTGEINNNEVATFYHATNLFVSASDSESQGLTYIEALASDKKIVVNPVLYGWPAAKCGIRATFKTQAEMVEKMIYYLKHDKIGDHTGLNQTLKRFQVKRSVRRSLISIMIRNLTMRKIMSVQRIL